MVILHNTQYLVKRWDGKKTQLDQVLVECVNGGNTIRMHYADKTVREVPARYFAHTLFPVVDADYYVRKFNMPSDSIIFEVTDKCITVD